MKNKKVLYKYDNTFLKLTKTQEEKLNFLKQLFFPYTKKVYIVGGTLRDIFLNTSKTNKDIDLEVHNISIELFNKLMNNIGANGIGKSFFVYKYENIDISLARVESKISYGHKGFEVKLAKDEKQASLRRDFTMNALMFNIFSFELYDFHNGIEDIKNKHINIVNKQTFKDDSLRVLRAIRFSCIYNLKISKSSIKIMNNMDISDLSNSRIINELKLIFKSNYLEVGLYYLIKTGIFTKLFNKNITFKEFIFLYRYIKRNKKYFNNNLKEFYLLHILKKFIDTQIINLNLPNRYKIINKDSLIDDNINNEDLMYLATKKPINNYLDGYKQSIIEKSIKLNIYKNRLDIKIDVEKIINQGYKNSDISKQIELKIKEKIKIFLE